ncbi:MAG: response regulator transcription factor [Chloroflexi bacterium]|nr:response regulator transcription factor [Chloroflexota bacterium]MBU1746853.1 response regulator transcription factor [Chloroflexota bacterium]
MAQKKRLLVADDHVLFREGLVRLLAEQPDFQVVGQAAGGTEAIALAREVNPDLILLDIDMPDCDGLVALRTIRRLLPATPIIMLTVYDDDEKLFAAVRGGAQGYLLKSVHAADLVAALRRALDGEAALSPGLAQRILEEFIRLSHEQLVGQRSSQLTSREQEILELLTADDGISNAEIAKRLGISTNTVKRHVASVLAKLQVHSREEAADYARRMGQGSDPQP